MQNAPAGVVFALADRRLRNSVVRKSMTAKEEASFRLVYSQWPTDRFARATTLEKKEYLPEAIALMIEELGKRGVEETRIPEIVASSLPPVVARAPERDTWAAERGHIGLDPIFRSRRIEMISRMKTTKRRLRPYLNWLLFFSCIFIGGCVSSQDGSMRTTESSKALRRAQAAFERGDLDSAITESTKAIELEPNNADAYCFRGRMFSSKSTYSKAIPDFEAAIRLNPRYLEAYSGMGDVLTYQSEYDRAIIAYDEALRLEPANGYVFFSRGVAYCRKGDYKRGVADYDEGIRVSPQTMDNFYGRGIYFLWSGDIDRALSDLNHVILLNPKYEGALNLCAWILATNPDERIRDGSKAVEFARRACELTQWKIGSYVDTLAAAYAEIGDFEEAKKREKQYLEFRLPKDEIERARNRLSLYEQRKPYRELKPSN